MTRRRMSKYCIICNGERISYHRNYLCAIDALAAIRASGKKAELWYRSDGVYLCDCTETDPVKVREIIAKNKEYRDRMESRRRYNEQLKKDEEEYWREFEARSKALSIEAREQGRVGTYRPTIILHETD